MDESLDEDPEPRQTGDDARAAWQSELLARLGNNETPITMSAKDIIDLYQRANSPPSPKDSIAKVAAIISAAAVAVTALATGFNYWSQTQLAEQRLRSDMANLAVSARDDLTKVRLLQFIAASERSTGSEAKEAKSGQSRASALAKWAGERLTAVENNRSIRIQYRVCARLVVQERLLADATDPQSQTQLPDGTTVTGGSKDAKADHTSVVAALEAVVPVLRTQLSAHAPELASALGKVSTIGQAQILCADLNLAEMVGGGASPPDDDDRHNAPR
ncbi:MAG: hypothetical protein KC731_29200 [Myxococcales bacterium]|nr:hypothetical protein [Myxococcales bacterium]